MTTPPLSVTPADAGPSLAGRPTTAVHGWELFLLAAVLFGVASWYFNDVVLTRDVVHRLLDARLDGARIDAQLDLTRRFAVVGYLAGPLVLWARIGIVALSLQLPLLLAGTEIGLSRTFRVAAGASLPLAVGAVVRALWLSGLEPSALTASLLGTMPGSLALAVCPADGLDAPACRFLSTLNPFEAAWAVVAWLLLTRGTGTRVSHLAASLTVGGTWLVLTVLQWGVGMMLNPAA